MDTFRIAVAQMTSTDDVDENLIQISELLKVAFEAGGVNLVCFPENCLFLRLGKSKPMSEISLASASMERIQKWCDLYKLKILLGSVPVKNENQRLANATVYFEPNEKCRVVYEKMHLFDVEVKGAPPVRESDFFQMGSGPAILNVDGWKLGLSICYDMRFSSLYSYYANQQVDVIVVPSAFLVPTGKAHWHTLLRARAIESQCFVVAAAQAGLHTNLQHDRRETFGHSLVVDPWGEVLLDMGPNTKGLKIVELSRARLNWVREQIPQLGHRRQI